MKRLVLATLVSTLLIALAAVGSEARAEVTLHGSFHVLFPKGHQVSNAPCPPDVFCGVGAVAGYGLATITILDEGFDDLGNGCFAVTRVEGIDLIDGSGTVVLSERGSFCRPGGSGDSHAGSSSYGHPGTFRFTYRIVDGTGRFGGASGAGSVTQTVAGAAAIWHLGG
jgi:hypothetical protein